MHNDRTQNNGNGNANIHRSRCADFYRDVPIRYRGQNLQALTVTTYTYEKYRVN